MIISHKHKFIFLHCKKTGGTSVDISLSRYCDKNDIITPFRKEDENIREKFGVYAQNYKIGNNSLHGHIPSRELKSIIGEDIWNSYYKFCFDRNPWDKVVSMYYFQLGRSRNYFTFDQYMDSGRYRTAYNYPIYTLNSAPVVDYLGKYETLESDLKTICKNIGLQFDGWLPNAKGEFRKNRQHYSTHYNEHQKEIIENYFKKEINLLGYKY